MRREIKILLVVFGSLFGLLALGIIALVIAVAHYGPALVKDVSADPAASKRTAEKIATFDIPRGYRISEATDLNFSQIVTIRADDRTRSPFTIQLQGSALPSRSDASLAGMKMGMGFMSRFAGCNLKDDGIDDVVVRGVHVKLTVLRCAGSGLSMRVESGVIPGNAAQVTVTATGVSDRDFDTNALHELLRSVR